MEEAILKLIELVQQTAPQVWAITRQRVVYAALLDLVFVVIWVVVAITIVYLARKARAWMIKTDDCDEYECDPATIIAYPAAAIILVLDIFMLYHAILDLLSTDYAVMHTLLGLVK